MKSLKPSHREKKRYLLIEGKDATKQRVEKIVLDYIGVLGYAKASPQIIKSANNKLILAINRKSLNEIRAAFLLSGKNLRIKRVSGTLRKLKSQTF